MADTTENKSAKDETEADEAKVSEAETDAQAEGASEAEAQPAAGEDVITGTVSEEELGTSEPQIDTEILDPAEETTDKDTVSSESERATDQTSETSSVTPAPAPVVRETVVEKKGGFLPMALGGVVAAGLGFAASQFGMTGGANPFEDETRAALSEQGDQIGSLSSGAETLRGDLDTVSERMAGIATLESGLAGVQDTMDGLDARLTEMGDQIAAVESRMTALEKQPLAEAVSPEAIAAYERELEALRTAVRDQQAALEAEKAALSAQIDQRSAEMQQIVEEARALEANAEEQAELAAARSALADLTARAQAGQPFAEPMAVLEENGVEVPNALQATAAEGIPTLSALTADFPDAARAALRAARTAAAPAAEGAEAEATGGGLSGFFQSQLGARSVVPREGNDPDAVLSRAEAAVKAGDLDAALTEIEALPEPARAALSDWTDRAELRRDALAAAADLAQKLNQQ